MKIGNRLFVFPILIRLLKSPMISYGDGFWSEDSYSMFTFILRYPSKMGGTMRTTDYLIDIQIGSWKRQFDFCWRPDVTHYWFIREPRYKKSIANQKKI